MCVTFRLLLVVFLVVLAGCGGGSAENSSVQEDEQPAPSDDPVVPIPLNLEALTQEQQVTLRWEAVPDATGYAIFWRQEGRSEWQRIDLPATDTSFVHQGLAEVGVYEYSIATVIESHESERSPIIIARLGLVPGQIDWVAVTSREDANTVHWAEADGANSYIIVWSQVRNELVESDVGTASVEVASPPWDHEISDPDQQYFYRVYGVNGLREGPRSLPAKSTVFHAQNVDIFSKYTAALWDMDNDGCLDAVAAYGDCDGGFNSVDPAAIGIDNLLATGRANRDSRIADFNGDGYPDIFTNVYSRADNGDSNAILHFNNGDGTFTQDTNIQSMNIGGFGETVVAADFNNDGAIDIFVPHYFDRDDRGRYWLLVNDGEGVFQDMAEDAGVSKGEYAVPEAAQALDFDQDGLIDIFVASQLFRNNGDLTFSDLGAEIGFPILFDEGAKFSDIDLDGDMDFIHHDSFRTRSYLNVDGFFGEGLIFNEPPESYGYGVSICDLNADGWEDVIVANNDDTSGTGTALLYLNVGGELKLSRLPFHGEYYNDLLVCADINNDGALDILSRSNGYTLFLNQYPEANAILVRVLGESGQMNQQGRVVRLIPDAMPGKEQIRFVESGSGYMTQGGYDVYFAAPWQTGYEVLVRFADDWVSAKAEAGDSVFIRENGEVTISSIGEPGN